jgi:hypothetical protein
MKRRGSKSRREILMRKQRMARATSRIALRAIHEGQVRTPSQLYDELLRAAAIAAYKHRVKISDRFLRRIVEKLLPAATDLFLHLLKTNAQPFIEADRDYRVSFESRLDERWNEGLRLCELVRILSLDAGMEYHDRHKAAFDAQHLASVKLHARSCLISAEILSLLRSGHASGSHARWRALHEVAVIADFLAGGDSELSHRYLLYEHVESLNGARDYNTYASDLGHDPIPEDELQRMRATVDELCDEFGTPFKSRNGWAAAIFGFAPTFRNIEEASGIGHLRPYYRIASHPIHAGPKGIAFDIGLGTPGKVMLAGPSDQGLADPGHGMCISLMQVTTSFVTRRPTAGDLVNLQVLQKVVDQAGDALIQAHHDLENEISSEERRVGADVEGA